jgi:hypothetical protein
MSTDDGDERRRERLERVIALVTVLDDDELAALERILLREIRPLAKQPEHPQVSSTVAADKRAAEARWTNEGGAPEEVSSDD